MIRLSLNFSIIFILMLTVVGVCAWIIFDFKSETLTANELITLAKNKGVPTALSRLRSASVDALESDYHTLAHAVFDVYYDEVGFSGITTCTDEFESACAHSLVVRALIADQISLDEVARACFLIGESKDSLSATSLCFHGIGHGLVASYQDSEFEHIVDICLHSSGEYSVALLGECLGGASMEMTVGHYSQSKLEQLISSQSTLCDGIEMTNQEAMYFCYLYQAPVILGIVSGIKADYDNQDYIHGFDFCQKYIGRKSAFDGCVGGLAKEMILTQVGRDQSKITTEYSPYFSQVINICTTLQTEDAQKICLTHVINALYWGEQKQAELITHLCDGISHPDHKKTCYHQLEFLQKSF